MQSQTAAVSPLFLNRRAGVLLHPTSLPHEQSFYQDTPIPQPHGNLGKDAYNFVDFLAESGITLWQMLPTTPTHADLSPYQSVSSHAGNPDLISIDWLIHKGWVSHNNDWNIIEATREDSQKIRSAFSQEFYTLISQDKGASLAHVFDIFCSENAYWLDDFVLFMALRQHFENRAWTQWPVGLKKRSASEIKKYAKKLSVYIELYKFEQFAFAQQWQELRGYAAQKNIKLFGDIPIFVAHDSADVWAAQEFFNLDEEGNALTVAGVPPDYFSETGQHWGNPHYNWDAMVSTGFSWWLARLRTQLNQFDLIRIDHFRGFEAFWSIPGDSHDARLGQWVKAPGEAFLSACFNCYPNLPLVAENLGVITPEVEALRHQFNLPGMLVLQFAFDGNNRNPHLPHFHTALDVIYTGTHDNDTTLSWFNNLSIEQKQITRDYLFSSEATMPWLLIDAALASVSAMAIIPMQDLLELGGEHRMNMPGTTGNNWCWQFNWQQLPSNLTTNLRSRLHRYARLVT
jgi:4-alpha-glucanotransferase